MNRKAKQHLLSLLAKDIVTKSVGYPLPNWVMQNNNPNSYVNDNKWIELIYAKSIRALIAIDKIVENHSCQTTRKMSCHTHYSMSVWHIIRNIETQEE